MDLKLLLGEESIECKVDLRNDCLIVSHNGADREYAVTPLSKNQYILRTGNSQHLLTVLKEGSKIFVITDGYTYSFDVSRSKDDNSFGTEHGEHGDKSKITAPMPGKVVKVLVETGQVVVPKQRLVIVEAMKMENPLVAPFKAEVISVGCAAGELVDVDKVLIELKKLA